MRNPKYETIRRTKHTNKIVLIGGMKNVCDHRVASVTPFKKYEGMPERLFTMASVTRINGTPWAITAYKAKRNILCLGVISIRRGR